MQRDELLRRYREGPDQLEAAVRGLSERELDYLPRDGGWSPREVLHGRAEVEHNPRNNRMRALQQLPDTLDGAPAKERVTRSW